MNDKTKTGPTSVSIADGDAVRQYIRVKQVFLELRGQTQGENKKPIPKTTVADVKRIAAAWSREINRISPSKASDRREHARWRACLDEIKKVSKGLGPNAVYPENERFWQACTRRVAIYLESRKVKPPAWTLAVEAVSEALVEAPRTVGRATGKAVGWFGKLLASPLKLVLGIVGAAVGAAIVLPPVLRAARGS